MTQPTHSEAPSQSQPTETLAPAARPTPPLPAIPLEETLGSDALPRWPETIDPVHQTMASGPKPPAPPQAESSQPGVNTGLRTVANVVDNVIPAGEQVLPMAQGYKLIRRLGHGSFGEVWRAEAPGGVDTAIKIISRPLDDETSKRELQSLELIKKLRHHYLLSTQAYFSLSDRLYIVMELADGNLSDRLKHCKAQGLAGVPREELIGYFREAAEGLDFLHAQNVQHRDIKPDNILLLQNHVKLADFGLARILEQQMTAATFCGTPAYMAPEVWQGHISPHSDQYSLAMTYAELRQGHPAYPRGSITQLMFAHVEGKPDLTGLEDGERQAILKAMNKDPNARYGSCRAFVQALDEALHPAPAPAELPPPVGRKWLVLAAAAVVLTVVGAVVAVLLARKPVDDHPSVNPEPALFVPPGFEGKAEELYTDARGNRRLYRRLLRTVPGAAAPLEFILITKDREEDPDTFYIAENKVMVGAFRVFATNRSIKSKAWNKDDDPLFPVRRVEVADAYQFAVEVLHGNLPTAEQWDKAAGYNEDPAQRGEGPFQGQWEKQPRPIIALQRPMKAGEARDDVSRFGCRDMAGNGREWLRTIALGRRRTYPEPGDPLLRGSPFGRNQEPFRFKDIKEDTAGSWSPQMAPPSDVGFRVVVELDSQVQ
jgi:serine/threonine protein kinase